MTYTTVPRSRPRIPQRYGSRWPPSLRLTPAMSESVGSGAGEQLVERRYRRVVGQADALAAAGPRAPHEARGARFTSLSSDRAHRRKIRRVWFAERWITRLSRGEASAQG